MKNLLLFALLLFTLTSYGQTKDLWVSNADESQFGNIRQTDIIQIKNNGSLIEFFLVGPSGIRTKTFEAKDGYKSLVKLPDYMKENSDWLLVENNSVCSTYLNLRHVTAIKSYNMGGTFAGMMLRIREFDDAFRISADNQAIKQIRMVSQLSQ